MVICWWFVVVHGHLLVVCGGLWPLLVLVTTSSNDKLQKYSCKTNTNSKNVITVSAIESWNNSQNYLKTILLKLLTPSKIKLLLSNEYLKNY